MSKNDNFLISTEFEEINTKAKYYLSQLKMRNEVKKLQLQESLAPLLKLYFMEITLSSSMPYNDALNILLKTCQNNLALLYDLTPSFNKTQEIINSISISPLDITPQTDNSLSGEEKNNIQIKNRENRESNLIQENAVCQQKIVLLNTVKESSEEYLKNSDNLRLRLNENIKEIDAILEKVNFLGLEEGGEKIKNNFLNFVKEKSTIVDIIKMIISPENYEENFLNKMKEWGIHEAFLDNNKSHLLYRLIKFTAVQNNKEDLNNLLNYFIEIFDEAHPDTLNEDNMVSVLSFLNALSKSINHNEYKETYQNLYEKIIQKFEYIPVLDQGPLNGIVFTKNPDSKEYLKEMFQGEVFNKLSHNYLINYILEYSKKQQIPIIFENDIKKAEGIEGEGFLRGSANLEPVAYVKVYGAKYIKSLIDSVGNNKSITYAFNEIFNASEGLTLTIKGGLVKGIGTIIHELTHAVIHKIFSNQANPYSKGDNNGKEKFSEIYNNFKQFLDQLGNTPQSEYIKDKLFITIEELYNKSNYHSEFIARIFQLNTEFELNGDQEGLKVIQDLIKKSGFEEYVDKIISRYPISSTAISESNPNSVDEDFKDNYENKESEEESLDYNHDTNNLYDLSGKVPADLD